MPTGKKTASRGKRSTMSSRRGGSSTQRTSPRSKSAASKMRPSSRGGSQKRSTATKSGGKRASTRSRGGRSSSSQTTIDHDEIRQWVESHGGSPATVAGTERDSEAAGLLRIDFPGYSGEQSLTPIDWDEFFEKFEEAKLAFLYDTDKKSKFNKFVHAGTNASDAPQVSESRLTDAGLQTYSWLKSRILRFLKLAGSL